MAITSWVLDIYLSELQRFPSPAFRNFELVEVKIYFWVNFKLWNLKLNVDLEMEMENYLVSITTKRKELEVVHDLSLSSLPKKIKLEHANFPQFLEEGEDSPVAVLFNPRQELVFSINNQAMLSNNYNINDGIEVMEEDHIVVEEETTCSLMEVESKSKFNQHDCMLPEVPLTKSAYLWSGFF